MNDDVDHVALARSMSMPSFRACDSSPRKRIASGEKPPQTSLMSTSTSCPPSSAAWRGFELLAAFSICRLLLPCDCYVLASCFVALVAWCRLCDQGIVEEAMGRDAESSKVLRAVHKKVVDQRLEVLLLLSD